MSNETLAQLWPDTYRRGWIRIVGHPASNYDVRTFRPEARRRDLERRRLARLRKKAEGLL